VGFDRQHTRIALATTKKNHLSVSDCYAKMCTYADELAASGAPLRDDELVAYILAGLNEDFNPVFTAVVAQVDPIKPSELYSQLLSFEHHTNLQANSSTGGPSSAMSASRGRDPGAGRAPAGYDRGRGRGRARGRGRGGSSNRVVALVTHPDQNVRFVVSLGIVPRLASTGMMKMMPLNSALRL
jgi:hypothetical protein